MSAALINSLFPPHPTLDQPTAEELARMKPAKVHQLARLWAEAVRSAELDPLNNGDVLDPWHTVIAELERPECDSITIFGGNRSSKTTLASYLIMLSLLRNPGSRIFCWSQTKDTSELVQQPSMWRMMPPDLRGKAQYKIATGFVGNRFVLPNGSSCHFWSYSQYILNPVLIEGIELGYLKRGQTAPFIGNGGIGNYFDEYLIAPTLYDYMGERLSTFNSKNLTTFTPILQYTETVEQILEGMETVEEQRTLDSDPECIRGMTLPFVQRCGSKTAVFMPTHANPYHNYARSQRNMAGKPKDWVLMKLYGVPTKVSASRFPQFDESRHVASAN